MKVKITVVTSILVMVLVLVVGCASTRKARDLEQANQRVHAQNDQLKAELEEAARRLEENDRPEKNNRIEGHTDNVPIGPRLKARYPTNWELGAARAVNVARFLQGEAGIDPLRLSAVSYGQYRPVASNKTAAGRARNRRIEIILIDRDLDLAKKMRQYL